MDCSYSDKRIVYITLRQVEAAILQITEWNGEIHDAEDYLSSNEGMKTLAATSMMIEAIGESVRKIDTKTDGKFLYLQPEIPWREIMNIRNIIAHGYFDIDAFQIFDVVSNDLAPLLNAVRSLMSKIEEEE